MRIHFGLPPDAISKNKREGFWQWWKVYDRYELIDGIAVGLRDNPLDEQFTYPPALQPALPSEFAQVSTADDFLAFVRRRGLLGFGEIAAPEERCGGDPVVWALGHAETVRKILELALEIKKVEQRKSDKKLRQLLGVSATEDPWTTRTKRSRKFLALYPGQDPLESAQCMIYYLLEPNLEGLRLSLAWPAKGPPKPIFQFRALLDIIYWHVLRAVTEGHPRRCPECGHLFVSDDPRQQYCPPRPGSKRSACALRHNVREFRKRERKVKHGSPKNPRSLRKSSRVR